MYKRQPVDVALVGEATPVGSEAIVDLVVSDADVAAESPETEADVARSVPLPASEIRAAQEHLGNGTADQRESGVWMKGNRRAKKEDIELAKDAQEKAAQAKLSDEDKAHLTELKGKLEVGELPEGFKVDYKSGETTTSAAERHLQEVNGRFEIDDEISAKEAEEQSAKDKAAMDEIEAGIAKEHSAIDTEVGDHAATLPPGLSRVSDH